MKTIKHILIALFSASLLIFTPGCLFDFDDDEDFFGCVNGDGSIVSEEINLRDFDGIDLRISADVYVRQGAEQRVVIEGQRNIIDEIERDVDNGIWEIETDRCIRSYDDLRIYITVPDVTLLRVSGSGDIVSENTLVVDDIELSISGSGTIDAALDADDINAKISGSGDILLEGEADQLVLTISGSGDFRAFNLPLRSANVTISGSGDVDVRVEDELDVRISGSGDVNYKGNPRVDARVSGSGRVVNAN
ncbi:MAG: head GIN domain-containing protein [Saprospiraceae bacterium]